MKQWRDTQLCLIFKSKEHFKPLVEMPSIQVCTSLGQRQYLSSCKAALPVSVHVPHHGAHVLVTREDCGGSSALPCVYTSTHPPIVVPLQPLQAEKHSSASHSPLGSALPHSLPTSLGFSVSLVLSEDVGSLHPSENTPTQGSQRLGMEN